MCGFFFFLKGKMELCVYMHLCMHVHISVGPEVNFLGATCFGFGLFVFVVVVLGQSLIGLELTN